MDRMAWRSLRGLSRVALARNVDLQVEGLEHLPERGPAIVAARHYHHLYDGCALMVTIPRQIHLVVGLDWISSRAGLAAMTAACRAAAWPVVFRNEGDGRLDDVAGFSALRRSLTDSLDVLRRGNVLILFPEGYPTIDPHPTPKSGPDEILPFQFGFIRIARAAEAAGLDVPVIPAGFAYEKREKWNVALRYGEPVHLSSQRDRLSAVREVEDRVKQLSVIA